MGLFDRFFSKKSVPPSVQAEQASSKKPTASDYEGPPSSQAVEYAKRHPTELLNQFDEKTKIKIAQIVSDGIQNKRGLPGISRDIRKEFPDVRKELADTIALTETNNALSHATLERMRKMGIDGKKWIVIGHLCEICNKNATVGVIPIEQFFPSGDLCPPAHINCRCALSPARFDRRD